MATRTVAALAALLTLLAGAAPAHAYTVLDFVVVRGIEYLRSTEEPGRELTRADLAGEVAVVNCGIAEDPLCAYGTEGSAGLLPAGTRLHAVRGYAPAFRVAAVADGHVLLYQAWRGIRVKGGGELYDLAGKVRSIDVRRDGSPGHPGGAAAMIRNAADVDALARMIAAAPVGPPRARDAAARRYWLTFWLADGTTLGRAYYPDVGELTGGVVLPPEFRSVLERHLGQ